MSGVDECELILIRIVPEKCAVVKLAFSHDWHAIKRAVKHSSKKSLYQPNIAAGPTPADSNNFKHILKKCPESSKKAKLELTMLWQQFP